jgi:hypothetical protein
LILFTAQAKEKLQTTGEEQLQRVGMNQGLTTGGLNFPPKQNAKETKCAVRCTIVIRALRGTTSIDRKTAEAQ